MIGFMVAGVGHGTYVVIALSSAPLGLLGIAVALFGGPVLWSGVGILLALAARSKAALVALVTVMLSHYAGLLFTLGTEDWFANWGHLPKGAVELVWVAVALYGFGQVAIWIWLVVELAVAGRRPTDTGNR